MYRSARFVLEALSTLLLIVLLHVSITSAEEVQFRLPQNVKPTSYDVTLRPNYPANPIDVTDFEGEVTIQAKVIQPTDKILLHAGQNVKIQDTKVSKSDGTPIEINPSNSHNKDTDILTITINEIIEKDTEIEITFEFTGKLESDMHGFYKSKYSVKNGKEDELRFLLATQFESTYARKAFPCFDEPKFKATFKVTLKVPKGYGALSNKEVDNIASTETLIKFPETVEMSTYLLAFIVYDKASFGPSIGVIGTDDVKFTSWGRLTAMKNHLGDYSQTITHRILSELDDFTGIPYSKDGKMTKVDQAAIPDFSSGAMENWGLVTYRETGLLFDEVNGAESSRKGIAMVIAHELTHQWFGNLVTLDWWSDTWLNEGFARYFQYYIVGQIHPNWRMMEQFVVDVQMSVFANDALSSGVTLSWDVNSQDDIDAQFSSANYQKGGVVVRLLSVVLGPTNFQKGLNDYLTQRSYSTATTQELFTILEKHYDTDVKGAPEFMKLMTWAETAGYPVVTFERNSANTEVTISQERFLLEKSTDSDTIYPVYLEWTTRDGESAKQWLLEKQSSSSDALPRGKDEWFLVNNTGYFRVNYDIQNWQNLYSQLTKHELERIAPVDRATLVDNAFNFARVKRLQYDQALAIISYLKRETDYIPWAAAFNGFSFLHRMLINVDESGLFNSFVSTLIQSAYDYLQFQDRGDHLEKIHRASTLSWACRVGIEDCHNAAVDLITAYIKEGREVSANLRSVAYCYGIKSGPPNTWLKMWQKLEENEDAAERSLLISALGCSKSYSTLYMYLEQSLTGNVIRQQDSSSVFSAVYSNPEGVDVALDFLVENFDRIKETYVAMNALRNTVTGVANYITKKEQQAKMEKLVNDNPEDLESIGKIALATIETNLEWLDTYKDDVLKSIEDILSNDQSGEKEIW